MSSVKEIIKKLITIKAKGVIKIITEQEKNEIKELLKNTKTSHETIYELLNKYMDMEKTEKKICYLWTLGTYSHTLSSHYPYIYINSPKASGKSKLTKIMVWCSMNGFLSTNTSPAGLYYLITEKKSTIGFDESEILSDKERAEAINNILLSGFEEAGKILRVPKGKKGG